MGRRGRITPRPEWAAAAAGAVVLTGVQGIVPALPDLQRDLGIDDSTLSLVMLVYVLAGMAVAFPVGIVADRLGSRRVMVVALMVFGIVAAFVALWPSLGMLVAGRIVQGACFGIVLSLSVSILAESVNRARQATAQSRRVVIMSSTEAALPLVAGLATVAGGWQASYLLGLLALPVAVFCAVLLPPPLRGAESRTISSTGRSALGAVFTARGIGVQIPGFARFFLKFAGLTYFPLIADRAAGMDAAATGLVISVAAILGIVAAALVPPFLRRWRIGLVLSASIVLSAGPFLAIPWVSSAPLLIVIVLVAGLGDAILGVANNIVASAAAPADARAAFIGITATIRNAGKVAAPALVAGVAFVLPLGTALAVAGILGIAALTGVSASGRAVAEDARD